MFFKYRLFGLYSLTFYRLFIPSNSISVLFLISSSIIIMSSSSNWRKQRPLSSKKMDSSSLNWRESSSEWRQENISNNIRNPYQRAEKKTNSFDRCPPSVRRHSSTNVRRHSSTNVRRHSSENKISDEIAEMFLQSLIETKMTNIFCNHYELMHKWRSYNPKDVYIAFQKYCPKCRTPEEFAQVQVAFEMP